MKVMTRSKKTPLRLLTAVCLCVLYCWVAGCLAPLAALSSARGAEYFVSPGGDDSGPGNRQRPWKTIDRINRAAQAGDVVTFLPGDYLGTLSPQRNGQPGRPIVYRSERPLKARLLGGDPVVELQKRAHLVVDGFHVVPTNGRYLHAVDCDHLLLRNCRFEEARRSYSAARFVECRNVCLRDNVFTRLLSTSNGAVLTGNMIQADHCDRLVFEGNTLGHAGHSPAHLRECGHLVVRRNLFCAKWGRGFETFNATPMLFEENIVTEEVDSGGSADSRGKVLATDGIFRRNLIVRNYDTALASNSYIYRPNWPAWVLRNSRLYNNTLYRNHTSAWSIAARAEDLTTVSGNIWKNNVFCDNDPLGDFRALRLGHMGQGNRFEHNIFFGDRPGQKVIEKWISGRGYRRFTLSEAEHQLGGLFCDNIDADPQFVAANADDYRLSFGSPCIDAGAMLTTTTRDGHGRKLPVNDARWFYDGFGIAGQQGDLVFVGMDRRPARVTKTDTEGNILHLDREVRWQVGEPVSLPYVGRAPDLGAMEHAAEDRPWFYRVTVPPGIRWQRPADPDTPLVATDFEDVTLEQWGYVWNLDRKRDTGYARVRDTAAGGAYSLRLQATGNRSILGGDVKPPVWNLDRYPIVRFAYRIPQGVPVGVWLDAFDTEERGSGRVCVGGTSGRSSGDSRDLGKCRLVDDGQWHTLEFDARMVRDTFPNIKYLQSFQFYTQGNGRKGQQFWIDDFAIEPDEGQ